MAQQRIAVLMGGANTERNVSLSSGEAVATALRALGHAVAEVDSARPPDPGRARPGDHFRTRDVDVVPGRPQAPTATAPPSLADLAALRRHQEDGVLHPGLLPILQAADVVFLTVFGDEGESGATQAYLERHGIAHTGPSAEVCARTFDKVAAKAILREHGVTTPAWHVVRRDRRGADLAALDVPGPWIVKPVAGGSTIGLSYVEDRADLAAAVDRASAEGADALVEACVKGRDLTIGMLGDRVLAIVEISTDRELYDYTAKYRPGESHKTVPADLTGDQAEAVRELTAHIHEALGIGDTSSRVDLRIDDDGRLWFLETNPLPGLTPTSSYPISARAEGIDFPDLCAELVERTLARHRRVATNG